VQIALESDEAFSEEQAGLFAEFLADVQHGRGHLHEDSRRGTCSLFGDSDKTDSKKRGEEIQVELGVLTIDSDQFRHGAEGSAKMCRRGTLLAQFNGEAEHLVGPAVKVGRVRDLI